MVAGSLLICVLAFALERRVPPSANGIEAEESVVEAEKH